MIMTCVIIQKNIVPDSWEDECVFSEPACSIVSPFAQVFQTEVFSEVYCPPIIKATIPVIKVTSIPMVVSAVPVVPKRGGWFKKPPTQRELALVADKLKQKEDNKNRQIEAAQKIKDENESIMKLISEKNLKKFGVSAPSRFITRSKPIIKEVLLVEEEIKVVENEENDKKKEEEDEEEEIMEVEVSNIMKEWLEKKEDETEEVSSRPKPAEVSYKTQCVVSQRIIPGLINITPVSLIRQRKSENSHFLQKRCTERTGTDATYAAKYMDRCAGFNMLIDKKVMEDKLGKTKMCTSVIRNTRCPHGDKCRFAHLVSELKPSICCFGETCKLVKTVDGFIINRPKNKVCFFIHAETIDAYHTRISSSITPVITPVITSSITPVITPVIEKVFVAAPVKESIWKKVSIDGVSLQNSLGSIEAHEEVEPTPKKVFIPAPVKESCWRVFTEPVPVIPSNTFEKKQTIHIRVPASVVEEAMRAIIESGFTHIKLVVY
jgi:hypothetical protein